MPLAEHLRELRGRLGKSIIAIVIAASRDRLVQPRSSASSSSRRAT
jgi:Sec-independent protein secretion pathway component TatC